MREKLEEVVPKQITWKWTKSYKKLWDLVRSIGKKIN